MEETGKNGKYQTNSGRKRKEPEKAAKSLVRDQKAAGKGFDDPQCGKFHRILSQRIRSDLPGGFEAPGKLSGGESSAENGRQPGRSRCKGRPARYFGSPRRAVESDFPELAPGFLSFRKKMDCCFCSAELSYGGPVINRSCQNILR